MNAHVIAPWSQAEIDLAAHLWSRKGYTGKQIAEALNRRFGTERSEVLVLRLATRFRDLFPPRGPGHSALARVFERLEARREFVEVQTKGEAAAYDAASRRVPLVDLSHDQCRFPVDTIDGTHLFCGNGREPLRSYCRHHQIRASRGVTAGDLSASNEEKTACHA